MTPPSTESGYSLVWSDDFAGAAGSLPNQSNWNIVNAGPNAGNAECKDAFNCPAGHRMLFQAELCSGTSPFNQHSGIWPAFWALENDIRNGKNVSWPQCGEWDIFENAHSADFSLATLHYGRGGTDHLSLGGGGNANARKTFQVESFHTWALKWLDGTKFFQIKGSDVGDGKLWGRVAHKSFYPILNVAVGSNFPGGGQPDENTTTCLGSGLQVKYVAIYRTN
ncbi:glycoside hydrolase family 16 protein [Biscogniauxia mediterranea]|nr:glycoside hydrolase family 16 protein [Biscogniauxia mediterranea]